MIEFFNVNAGAVSALATLALLFVTGWYAVTTRSLLSEAKSARLSASEPRVVGYLRVHEVHSNIVQLCVANISTAAAADVTASINKTTTWPDRFDLEGSKVLRDLKFVGSEEVLKFDLGFGPDLFKEEKGAEFEVLIHFESLDGRKFTFKDSLKIESVVGPSWKIYGVDDVARRLEDISNTLKGFNGFRRLKVETYNAKDREAEETLLADRRLQLGKSRSDSAEVKKPD